ncbi:MAG: hypothetical protein J2O46_00805 [Nocardioides sp.]|nr:hypothetical protein [Nocardioides sp.]
MSIRTIVTGVLALALVLLVAANVVVRLRAGHDDGQAARVVAQQTATDFFSLSYQHPAKDVDAVLALSTGSFKKQYAAKRSDIVDSVTKNKLVVKATVPGDGAALEYLAKRSAQVLVAVDVHSTSNSDASDSRYRTRIKLAKQDDGDWLVSGLEQVG